MTTKRKKTKKRKTASYQAFLHEQLKDPELAAGFLTGCLEEGADVFLLAVKDVVASRGGVGALAKATALNREGLYSMLSKDGNPRLSSLTKVLRTLGMKLECVPRKVTPKKAA